MLAHITRILISCASGGYYDYYSTDLFLFSHTLSLSHAPTPLPPAGPRWPPTLSHLTLLSDKREPAYPDRQGPRSAGRRAGGQTTRELRDPELSARCPGSATGTERLSEMSALMPRATLRTALQTTWPHRSTQPILPTRLLPSRRSRRARA